MYRTSPMLNKESIYFVIKLYDINIKAIIKFY